MFDPLMPADGPSVAINQLDMRSAKAPIIPVPPEALPMTFQHPLFGKPTQVWEYQLADGSTAGFVARFDVTNHEGQAQKKVLPLTFCNLGNGRRGWRSKCIPDPLPSMAASSRR